MRLPSRIALRLSLMAGSGEPLELSCSNNFSDAVEGCCGLSYARETLESVLRPTFASMLTLTARVCEALPRWMTANS